MSSIEILGVPISTASLRTTINQVAEWAKQKSRCYLVTFSNAHMLALSSRSDAFRQILKETDMNCPDGAPVILATNIFANSDKKLSRVTGPDFLAAFCAATAESHIKHFFFGSGAGIAEKAAQALMQKNPGMQVAGCFSPPYTDTFSEAQIKEHCEIIKTTNADIVWVSLGCPKQEIWMHHAKNYLNNHVLLAVGQAIDIHAGVISRCPEPLRRCGLEWAYRLYKEPKRLWKRYAVYNSIFLIALLKQSLQQQPYRKNKHP